MAEYKSNHEITLLEELPKTTEQKENIAYVRSNYIVDRNQKDDDDENSSQITPDIKATYICFHMPREV